MCLIATPPLIPLHSLPLLNALAIGAFLLSRPAPAPFRHDSYLTLELCAYVPGRCGTGSQEATTAQQQSAANHRLDACPVSPSLAACQQLQRMRAIGEPSCHLLARILYPEQGRERDTDRLGSAYHFASCPPPPFLSLVLSGPSHRTFGPSAPGLSRSSMHCSCASLLAVAQRLQVHQPL